MRLNILVFLSVLILSSCEDLQLAENSQESILMQNLSESEAKMYFNRGVLYALDVSYIGFTPENKTTLTYDFDMFNSKRFSITSREYESGGIGFTEEEENIGVNPSGFPALTPIQIYQECRNTIKMYFGNSDKETLKLELDFDEQGLLSKCDSYDTRFDYVYAVYTWRVDQYCHPSGDGSQIACE